MRTVVHELLGSVAQRNTALTKKDEADRMARLVLHYNIAAARQGSR